MVKATIPGVGTVEVEGAASEYTLNQILAQIKRATDNAEKAAKGGGPDATVRRRETENIRQGIEARKDEIDALEFHTKQLDDSSEASQHLKNSFITLNNEITSTTGIVSKFGQTYVSTLTQELNNDATVRRRETENLRQGTEAREDEIDAMESHTDRLSESSEASQHLKNSFTIFKNEVTSTTGIVSKFGQAYVVTLTQVLSQYDAVAKSPIVAGAGQLSTAIDLSTVAVQRMANAAGSAAQGLALMIPIIGDGLSKAAQWATERVKESVDIARTVLKRGNEVMAQEFEKSRQALMSMTESGASFAGGLTELRMVAIDAALPIEEFTGVLKRNSQVMRLAGLSQGQGAKALAAVMEQTTKITGSSGLTLRDQMLGLGYSYEEQADLLAHYVAMDTMASGKRRSSDEEIARMTAEYAKDLKILQDITGQNAKQAQEEARMKAMEMDILSRLTTTAEVEKFTRALAAVPPTAKKGFLEAFSSGGMVITDAAFNITSAQLPGLREHVMQLVSDIRDPAVAVGDMTQKTLDGFAEVGAQARELGTEMAQAVRLANVTGGIANSVNMMNELVRVGMVTPEQIDKSKQAADDQAKLVDEQTKSLAAIIDLTNQHAIQMHNLTQGYATEYAGFLETTLTATLGTIKEAARLFNVDWEEFIKEETKKAQQLVTGKPESMELPDDVKAAMDETKKLRQALEEASSKRDEAYEGIWFPWFMSEKSKSEAQIQADRAEKEAQEKLNEQLNKNMELTRKHRESGAINSDAAAVLRGQLDPYNYTGKANGGISRGPTSGYIELLHGTEAVVPLPDGKSIPVSLSTDGSGDIKELVNSIKAWMNTVQTTEDRQSATGELSAMMNALGDIATGSEREVELQSKMLDALKALVNANEELVAVMDDQTYIQQRRMQLGN